MIRDLWITRRAVDVALLSARHERRNMARLDVGTLHLIAAAVYEVMPGELAQYVSAQVLTGGDGSVLVDGRSLAIDFLEGHRLSVQDIVNGWIGSEERRSRGRSAPMGMSAAPPPVANVTAPDRARNRMMEVLSAPVRVDRGGLGAQVPASTRSTVLVASWSGSPSELADAVRVLGWDEELDHPRPLAKQPQEVKDWEAARQQAVERERGRAELDMTPPTPDTPTMLPDSEQRWEELEL